MSDTMPEEPVMLAAEYALGTLSAAEMRQAEAMAEADPAFARDVAVWEQHLAPLAALVPPVTPPRVLWSRLALAAGIPARSPSGGRRFWQAATAVSLAVAASLALVAFLPRQTGGVGELAAALAPLNSPARFLALARPDGSIAVTSLGNAAAPPGRSYQLWSLPPGSKAPASLGLLTPGQQVVAARAAAEGQLLVSEEPVGGSTTGAPTGPVVFGGTLVPVNLAASPGR